MLTTADIVVLSAFAFLAILILSYTFYRLGKGAAFREAEKQWQEEIPKLREDAIKRSRSVLTGQFNEQLAPILPDFPFNSAEARFIGKPVDFLIFQGIENDNISEVVFVEVKTGQSRLSAREKSLKLAIENKQVRWAEYRINP